MATTAGEAVFLDTNFIVAVSVESHPDHRVAEAHFARLVSERARLFICPQICREFIVVLTRAPVGGVTITLAEALEYLEEWQSQCTLLDEHGGVTMVWSRLVARYGVLGKQIHDCNLIAVMKSYAVKRLVTFNGGDFKRFATEVELDAIETAIH